MSSNNRISDNTTSLPTPGWVTDEEETPSTSFTLVETTVVIETRSSAPLEEEKKNKITNNEGLEEETSPAGHPNNNTVGTEQEEAKMFESSLLSSNSIEIGEEAIPKRTHRLMSFQKPKEVQNNSFLETRKAFSLEERLNTVTSEDIRGKLLLLSSAFSARASRKKAKIRKPVTPPSDLSASEEEDTTALQLQKRLQEFLPPKEEESSLEARSLGWKVLYYLGWCGKVCRGDFVLDSQSQFYVCWLVVMSGVFLYNAWFIPLRSIFRCQTAQNVYHWVWVDAVADAFYALDIFIIKSRVMFVQDGLTVKDPKEIRQSYFRSLDFKVGLLSLLPLDIVCTIFYENIPWLRAFRFLKIKSFWDMFETFDSVLASPHPIRITRSVLYMLYLIHLYACAYYLLSAWEINNGYSTDWIFRDVYSNTLESYIRCFYFATKTATSIGKNPKPDNEIEYLFMSCAWLSGVFAFAILIGQLRDIIATATKNQTEYRQLLYATVSYLHRFDIPKEVQERVTLWLTYTWQQQRALDERDILSLLPTKMQTDLAIHMHIEMLNKVKLFQHCEASFLRELVPRFTSVIFLPGDYVCRKGEVGREMYIIKTGRVDVLGGSTEKEVLLASLKAGSIFGEIALLQIDGMDKRTADVRSAGFSTLFQLTKKDLEEVIRDYPAVQESLRKQAKKLIRQSQKRKAEEKSKERQAKKAAAIAKGSDSMSEEDSDVIIKKTKSAEPRLLQTVLQALPSNSKTARLLKFGTKLSPNLSIPDSLSSYPPSPYMPLGSAGFRTASDISLRSSLDSIMIYTDEEAFQKGSSEE